MRAKGGNATLGELIGGHNQEMSLTNIGDILGEKLPELPKNSVGRFRLVKALQQRFGDGFRNIPGVSNILKDFDEDIRFDSQISKMKLIKPKSKESK